MTDDGGDREPIAFRGELATPRRLLGRALALAAPALGWLTLFLLLPLLLVVAVGFCGRGDYGELEWRFTLDNLARACGRVSDGFSWANLRIVASTVVLAGGTTVLCLALAFPLALVIATRSPRRRGLALAAVMIPFCTNLVIRSYAWQLLLAGKGPVVAALAAIGLVEAGVPLQPSTAAVW